MHNWNMRRRGNKEWSRRNIGSNNGQDISKLMTNLVSQILEAQWTPEPINTKNKNKTNKISISYSNRKARKKKKKSLKNRCWGENHPTFRIRVYFSEIIKARKK